MNANTIEVTNELCDCGNDHKMKGWRVCLSCATARMMYPDWFDTDLPDRIEDEDGVSVESVILESRDWHWG